MYYCITFQTVFAPIMITLPPRASAYMKSNEDDTYSYYKGELTASYIFTIGNKPLIVRGAVSYDGYNDGFGKVDGLLAWFSW